MVSTITLSDAKARLSEVIRAVRTRGEEMIITVDGEPAARVVPVDSGPSMLTSAETASFRALMGGILRVDRPTDAFDAIELLGEGRR